MRYSRCLVIVLIAGFVLAGCGNSSRESSERLGDRIDEARRLFEHATTILVNPQSADPDTLAIEPVDYPQAEEKLAQAEELLKKAISDNPDAPLSTKSDALHLLGKIHLASGKYYTMATDCLHCKADDLRSQSHDALAMAESNLRQAQFGTRLANLPKGEINTLRDDTDKRLTSLNAAISKIDKEVGSKRETVATLSKANAALLENARKKRDDGEVAGGTKGLALFKQAQVFESEANDKSSEIAANQQAVAVLLFNKGLLVREQQDTSKELAAIKKSLKDMADSGRSMLEEVKATKQLASEQQLDAWKLAGQVVECCKDISKQEKLAIDALDDAVKSLDDAKKAIRRQIDAANAAMEESDKPNEILQTLSEEQNLEAASREKSSASLALGNLRQQQIITAKANADLADTIRKQASSTEATTLANGLESYLTDAGKTKTLAEENYKAAEDELQGILKLRLKGNAGNTLWVCQAMLANAYMGHYKLTGQSDVLAQAVEFVDKALEGKEDSPYLENVVKLQRLIHMAEK